MKVVLRAGCGGAAEVRRRWSGCDAEPMFGWKRACRWPGRSDRDRGGYAVGRAAGGGQADEGDFQTAGGGGQGIGTSMRCLTEMRPAWLRRRAATAVVCRGV